MGKAVAFNHDKVHRDGDAVSNGGITMRRFPAAVLLSCVPLLCTETRPASAAECYPHCDYNHYYGPLDFTYIRPGLYGYQVCEARGECLPNPVYSTTRVSRGRVTIRFPRLVPSPSAQ
jgi:hypothetical protein